MIAERERKKNVPQVLVDIRLQYYKDKRMEKIKMIKEVTYSIFTIISCILELFL
jgi:hypothetical protein